MIKELITFIVQKVVLHPDKIEVLVETNDDKTQVSISADEKDIGRLIGKDGQTIKAIRMLVNTVSQSEKKIAIDIAK